MTSMNGRVLSEGMLLPAFVTALEKGASMVKEVICFGLQSWISCS